MTTTADRCSCNHLVSQHDGPCRECRCPRWTTDWSPVPAVINDRVDWPLRLPPYRAYRASWATHEAARLAAMHETIRPGDVVYEVGAEEGDYGALFTSWGAKVVLVEPNPKAWPSIRASFEANGFRPAAWWFGLLSDRVWMVDDVERLGVDGWPDCAFGELVPEHGFFNIWEHAEVSPAVTLDELVSRTGLIPNVVSVDVEGGEFHVLRGARRTLRENRPTVFVSVHPEFMANLYGLDAENLYDFMADLGYSRTYLATDHEVHEMFVPERP